MTSRALTEWRALYETEAREAAERERRGGRPRRGIDAGLMGGLG